MIGSKTQITFWELDVRCLYCPSNTKIVLEKKKLRHTVGYRQRKVGLADVTDTIVPLSVDSLWQCGEVTLMYLQHWPSLNPATLLLKLSTIILH